MSLCRLRSRSQCSLQFAVWILSLFSAVLLTGCLTPHPSPTRPLAFGKPTPELPPTTPRNGEHAWMHPPVADAITDYAPSNAPKNLSVAAENQTEATTPASREGVRQTNPLRASAPNVRAGANEVQPAAFQETWDSAESPPPELLPEPLPAELMGSGYASQDGATGSTGTDERWSPNSARGGPQALPSPQNVSGNGMIGNGVASDSRGWPAKPASAGATQGYMTGGPTPRGAVLGGTQVTATEEALRLRHDNQNLLQEVERLQQLTQFLQNELNQNNQLLRDAQEQMRLTRENFAQMEMKFSLALDENRRLRDEKSQMERQHQADMKEIERKLDELFMKSLQEKQEIR